jgi:hypothetical protein
MRRLALALAAISAMACSTEGTGASVVPDGGSAPRRGPGEAGDAGALEVAVDVLVLGPEAGPEVGPEAGLEAPAAGPEVGPDTRVAACVEAGTAYPPGSRTSRGCQIITCTASLTWSVDASFCVDAGSPPDTTPPPVDTGANPDGPPPLPATCSALQVTFTENCGTTWPGTTNVCVTGCQPTTATGTLPAGSTLWSCFTWSSKVPTNNGQIVCVGGGQVGCNYYCPKS